MLLQLGFWPGLSFFFLLASDVYEKCYQWLMLYQFLLDSILDHLISPLYFFSINPKFLPKNGNFVSVFPNYRKKYIETNKQTNIIKMSCIQVFREVK